MDDMYGGFPINPNCNKPLHFHRYMYETRNLNHNFNIDAEKTPSAGTVLQKRKGIRILDESKLWYLDLSHA